MSPLPAITADDLRNALAEVLDPNADLDTLRDLRRIIANVSAYETRAVLADVIREHTRKVAAEFD